MAWAKSIGIAAALATLSGLAQAGVAPADFGEFWNALNRSDTAWLFVPAESHSMGPPALLTLIRGEIPTLEQTGPLWFTLPIGMPKNAYPIICRGG